MGAGIKNGVGLCDGYAASSGSQALPLTSIRGGAFT